jgi:hypothetical protein
VTVSSASSKSQRPPIATGWLLWLTWLYIGFFGLGILVDVASLVAGRDVVGTWFGVSVAGLDNVGVVWVLRQLPYVAFAIGCVGILLRDRDFAWMAIVAAWLIVAVQCVDAFLQIFHLRLSVPISAFVFGAYAWKTGSVLRPRQVAMPPRSGGML